MGEIQMAKKKEELIKKFRIDVEHLNFYEQLNLYNAIFKYGVDLLPNGKSLKVIMEK